MNCLGERQPHGGAPRRDWRQLVGMGFGSQQLATAEDDDEDELPWQDFREPSETLPRHLR